MREFAAAFVLEEILIEAKRPWSDRDLCLACLHADGRLELLSGGWENLLGFAQHQLHGSSFFRLLDRDPSRARPRVRKLLDPRRPDPVKLDVLRRDGSALTLTIYRLFDEYEPSLYLACEPFQEPEISRIITSTSARSRP
jgi:hypothetical protein